jgi:PBP1b-binding outer membrane lipoprotein LpoB
MKIILISLAFVMLALSGCSQKEVNHNGSYERANNASQVAQDKLTKE